ncbi:MAG: fibronectin type III domain-containing protein [Acidobacteria bacterium]|nr:fibronectin type III domain-containing protein [Acidobacteriota bacterium]
MRNLALLPLSLLLAACGYVGDPLPPSLHIPLAVADLRAEQKVDRLEVRFTLPELTTDNAGIRRFQDVELRAGSPGSERRIPVAQTAPGAVEVSVPVAEWGGTSVSFRVRSQGIRGRWSDWSAAVTVAVAQPVSAPLVKAEATTGGVKLSWEAAAGEQYLVFRTAAGEATVTQIGESTGASYLDATAVFDQTYTYRVRSAGSPLSQPVEITPRDTFAPPAPAGLSAVEATASVQLSWNPVESADLAAYQVYRAEGDGPFVRTGGRLTAPSYTDRDLRPGVRLRYRVTALDAAGNESEPSQTAVVPTP